MHADHENTDDIPLFREREGAAESNERKEIFKYLRTLNPPWNEPFSLNMLSVFPLG